MVMDAENKNFLAVDLPFYRDNVSSEYKTYINMFENVRTNPYSTKVHITFNFAEKCIMLLTLQNRPDKLHFVTCLTFDLFGFFF